MLKSLNRRRLVLTGLLVAIALTAYSTRYLLFRDSSLFVSAVTTEGRIGVYWDRACTKKVYSINWSTLIPGQAKQYTIYLRNEGNTTGLPLIKTTDWNPPQAQTYLGFSWKPTTQKLQPGQSLAITHTLTVSLNTKNINKFSFNMIYELVQYMPWDMNRDGKIDIVDITIVTLAYKSTTGSRNWNPNADLDKNGEVDILDLVTVLAHYGEEYA
jgi:hypothetical protein